MVRKNIKVSEEEFEELKEDKPSGVSWGHYLTEMRTLEGHEYECSCGVEFSDDDVAEIHRENGHTIMPNRAE